MPDTLQRAKQWGPGRAPSTAETLHPDALIDARAADFELCGDCGAVAPRAVHTGRVFSGPFFWRRTTLNTRYRLQALPPYQMASWPLRKHKPLSCLGRALSGSGVTQQQ